MDSGNSFEQDGFVKVPGFCAGEELALLETELEEFIQFELDALPPELVFYEDKSQKDSLKQIQQLHQYSSQHTILYVASHFYHFVYRNNNTISV